MLLLGFFLILFTISASQIKDGDGPKPPPLPGIDQLVTLHVRANGEMQLKGEQLKQTGILKSNADLLAALKGMSDQSKPGAALLLIHYENPWAALPRTYDSDLSKAIKASGFQYARIY